MTDTTAIPKALLAHYDRNLLTKAKPLFVHTKWAQVRDIPANDTDSIRFRRYTLLTAATTPLTEGVTPTGSTLSTTNVDATIAQYGDYITFTDKVLMTTLDPVLVENTDLLGTQAGDTLDQVTRDVLAGGSTIQYASSALGRTSVTSAMKITKSEVQEAVRTLKNANARKLTSMVDHSTGFNSSPLPACFIGIVHTNTVFDLKNIPGFVNVEEYGSQKVAMEGEVGTLDAVRFIETTNAKVFAAGGAGSIDVYATIILGADAYGISRIAGNAMKNIIKPLGSGGSTDPLDQRQTHGWKATFVATRLNESFMLRIEHAVSA